MRKLSFIILLSGFSIAAFAVKGSNSGIDAMDKTFRVNTVQAGVPGLPGKGMPALIATDPVVAFSANAFFKQMMIRNRCRFNSLSTYQVNPPSTIGLQQVSQQKNYLTCIYPSHNFW
jgi:hypothetical protein